MTYPAATWCRSRAGATFCTRPLGHPGLHNRSGTARMWADSDADPPACPGAGEPAEAVATLTNGFPHGAALCRVCTGFMPLTGHTISPHDAFRAPRDADEAHNRAEWFNSHGFD